MSPVVPEVAPETGRFKHHSITFHGQQRFYGLVTHSADPLALVVALHGYRSDGGTMLKQWTSLLNAGFALLLPEGARGGSKFRSWNAHVCCAGYALKVGLDDVGLIRALVHHVWAANASLARLRNKAFILGQSNGGFLTQLLALNAENGVDGYNFVAGAVSVAAVQWDTALYPLPPSKWPVPTLILHGQNDSSVNFTGCCHAQPQAEKCCCSISQASAVPCTSTLSIYQRWKRMHACALNAADDTLGELHAGYLLTGQGCQATTSLAVYPKGTHSLIVAVPSAADVVVRFLTRETSRQLGGSAGAFGVDDEAAASSKLMVLLVVVAFSLGLYGVVRYARRRAQWQLVPNQ